MTRFALALLALTGLTSLAPAQTMVARVVASCGAQSLNAGTPFVLTIDTSGNLCSGTAALSGSTSNASDGVATSSTNLPTVGYEYVFNGATWDRLRGDTTAGLWAQIKAALPAGTNIIGNVRLDQTTPGTTNGVQVNAALPAGTNVIGKTTIDQTTPGTTNAVAVQYGSTALVADPCQAVAKTSVAISQATNTKLFSQTSAKKNYICSVMIVGADAENLSLVEGTGSTCGTNTAAIIGAATAAAGPNLAANGGFSMGSGVATVASGTNANFDVCLFQSGSGRVAGVLTYVQQ